MGHGRVLNRPVPSHAATSAWSCGETCTCSAGTTRAGGDTNDVWKFTRAGGTWHRLEPAGGADVPASRSGHAAGGARPGRVQVHRVRR